MSKRALTMAVLALLLPGCAHNAEWMQRQPAIESMISNNPKTLPAGTSYGPRGMGVDPTDRSSAMSVDH